MSAVVVVGAQWGDEGKGKIVDLVSEQADMVVRYAGGSNAGHTLVVGEEKIVVRLVPSGILQPHSVCLLGPGMVIDPQVLMGEIDSLEERGVSTEGRILVSERAHLILPYHLDIDALREGDSGGTKIGTTKKGIGPAYEDKIARRGLRVGDLRDSRRTALILQQATRAWEPVFLDLGGDPADLRRAAEQIDAVRDRLLEMATDTSLILNRALKNKKRVLCEGAQGTLLDVDHGTYPYVTSSSAVAGGAGTGSGIGPSRIDRVLGVTKAYSTRVGEGPFPTELHDQIGEDIRQRGGEFGAVTGRPRRTGWLDLPALRYAARVNGIDGWAITKLDILTGMEDINVCISYETETGRTNELPSFGIEEAQPVYSMLPGWEDPIGDCRTFADLPKEARMLVRLIEEATEVEADIISVGPRRDQTIMVRDIFPLPR